MGVSLSNFNDEAGQQQSHEYWIDQALAKANLAQESGEVPVGAVLIKNNQIVSTGFNQPIQNSDPSAHAEIQAIRAACNKLNNYRLPNTVLYVTLEPCAMCAGAIIQARIPLVVFGAFDPRAGACGSIANLLNHPKLNHRSTVIGGILEDKCSTILKQFFKLKRKNNEATCA